MGEHSWQAIEEMVDRAYTENTPKAKSVGELLVMDEGVRGDYANLEKTRRY